MSRLPSNVHVSRHPCVRAKLSQLRSQSTNPRETKALIHEITLMLATEALSGLDVEVIGTDQSALGFEYNVETVSPRSLSIVPIMRSGLAMLDAVQTILPEPVPVHHLGLFREKISLQPVEYYNNLPQSNDPSKTSASKIVILIDPVVATGGTVVAALQTLKEWGVERIIVLSVLGASDGIVKAAEEWPEGTHIWIGDVDANITSTGMIQPGLGDIGDRLFLTLKG